MGREFLYAAGLAAGFTLLISVIEVWHRSKASQLWLCVGTAFLMYLVVLLVGNVASTAAAMSMVRPFVADAMPSDSETAAALTIPAQLLWFWSAFLGVFAFEAVFQRVNVTFADQGVLTIHDWINKARDSAVAKAIEQDVDARIRREQLLAVKLDKSDISDSDLNTYVQNYIGGTAVKDLEASAERDGANARLAKAIALAQGAYDRASKLV